MNAEILKIALDADIPVLLWGPPGTGKTSAVLSLAEEKSAHVETLIGSIIDPTDIGGLPVPDAQGQLTLSPPGWARRLRQSLDRDQSSWLFLDELACAPPSVQAGLLRVVLEQRAGEIDLTGMKIIAASNPTESSASGGELSPAMASRWMHVDWRVDVNEWCAGELSGWGNRPAVSTAQVTSYISRNPSALIGEPTDEGRGYPNPRAWSNVAKLDCTPANRYNWGIAVSGLVGTAAAEEYVTYCLSLDLPDPQTLLAGGALPKRADQLTAALASAISYAISNGADRIVQAWKLLTRVRPDQALHSAQALLLATGEIPAEAEELGNKILRVKNELKM